MTRVKTTFRPGALDFADEDGLLADASWRVDVLRQPAEPVKVEEPEPVPVPAPSTLAPAASVPIPESARGPAPSAPAYRPRRKSRAGLIIGLVVGIPLLVLMLTLASCKGRRRVPCRRRQVSLT